MNLDTNIAVQLHEIATAIGKLAGAVGQLVVVIIIAAFMRGIMNK